MNQHFSPVKISSIIVSLFLLACGGCTSELPTDTPTPTLAPTNTKAPTKTPIPTSTPKPTSTPEPSATPDIAATQQYGEFFTLMQTFDEKGYVDSTDGSVYELSPFMEEWAQIGWFRWSPYDFVGSDMVFNAHFNWSTASATPETSGCGVLFGLQENKDYYVVFLDKSRILFLMKRGEKLYEVGKTRGSGRTNFDNPAEADFALAVKGSSAYVSVNGEVTEYTLSKDQTTQGTFAVTILSGTNSDYGTRCEMTDMMLWYPGDEPLGLSPSAPKSDSAPPLAGEWHRLNAEDGKGNHQLINCQEGEKWTCAFNDQPEPKPGFYYSGVTGEFEGIPIPDWKCPTWFSRVICSRDIFVVGGTTSITSEDSTFPVDIEYIVLEVEGRHILYEYWVDQFACPWYRSFDEALVANPSPYTSDCIYAP